MINSDLFSWSIRTFSIGQFGPFPLVNSDLFHWSVRTFALCICHNETCVTDSFAVLYDGLSCHKIKVLFALANIIHQRIMNSKTQSTRKKTDGLQLTGKAFSLLTDRLITGLPLRRSERAVQEMWFNSNHHYIKALVVIFSSAF